MSDFSFRPNSLADLVLDEFMIAVQQKSGPFGQIGQTVLNSAKSKACASLWQRRARPRSLYITLHQRQQGETEPRYLPRIESHPTQEGQAHE
jgi:hypothetical protein